MPTYGYLCSQCERKFESFHSMKCTDAQFCPDCGGKGKKLMSASSIIFKGSGFYSTDYRDSGYLEAQKRDTSDSSKSSTNTAPAAPASGSGGDSPKPVTPPSSSDGSGGSGASASSSSSSPSSTTPSSSSSGSTSSSVSPSKETAKAA